MRVESWRMVAGATSVVGLLLSWLVVSDSYSAQFAAPKLMAIGLSGAVAVAAVSATIWMVRGRAVQGVPRWWIGAIAVVVGLLVLATGLSDAIWLSVLGTRNRNVGLLSYLSGFALLGAAVVGLRGPNVAWLIRAMVAAGAVLACWVIVDVLTGPADRASTAVAIVSIGNPNFTSAVMAIVAAAASGAAVAAPKGWQRVAYAVVVVVAVVAAWLTGSLQGPAAAVAGILAVAIGWGYASGGRGRRVGVPMLLVAAVGGIILLVLGVVGQGPLERLATEGNVQLRSYYWSAALEMGSDEPLTGVGLSRYPAYFRAAQSEASTADLGAETAADAAHSVPLQMLASGGLPLLIGWLAFLLATGALLIRAYRVRPASRGPLLALGGAWVAYIVQSLVSIDVIPLSTAHLVIAGGIAAAACDVAPPSRRVRRSADSRRLGAVLVGAGSGTLAAAFVVVFVGSILSAENAVGRTEAFIGADRPEEAIAAGVEAAEANGYDPDYALSASRAYASAQDPEGVRHWAEEGLRRDQRDFPSAVTAGRTAEGQGDLVDALGFYDQAVALAPRTPLVHLERGDVLRQLGRSDEATRSFEQAVDLAGDDPTGLLELADRLSRMGASGVAAVARERAVAES